MCKELVLLVAGLMSATAAAAQGPAPATAILSVSSHDELQQRFCAADATADLIIVLPAALFVDSEELICPAGPYKLYRILEHNDPDDFEYYLDPPFGATGRLGCDGKAGRAMPVIAVNCRPE